MSKRRRGQSVDVERAPPRVKRIKFTLDSVVIPSTAKQGAVFCTGTGDTGQLGLGPDVLERVRPALVKLDDEIVDICAGGMHTVCLTCDGRILTFGCNDEGSLGREIKDDDGEFVAGAVDLPAKVIQVTAGDSHTCVLLEDGRVFAWGTFRDSHGAMGLTINGVERLPVQIPIGQEVMKIASGADHIVFLTRFGELYTCGCAEQGQLGRVTMRGSGRTARNGTGQAQIAKLLTPAPIALKVSLKLHFEDIWTGTYATFAKVADKEDVYVFGLNNYWQIGMPDISTHYSPIKSVEFSKYTWKMITSAQHHALGLTTNGEVYAIGRKEYGRLGLGNLEDDAQVLTKIPFFTDKKVVAVSTATSQSFAVTEDGDLYSWGMGTGGHLGTGNEEDCTTPSLAKSKQLEGRKVIRVSGGGQHTVVLAIKEEQQEKKSTKPLKNGKKQNGNEKLVKKVEDNGDQ